MDKNMDQPRLILFNVDKGRLVDYMPCRDDRECGTYLLRQAELALEGSYVPAENIYGLDGRIESGTDIPGLLEDRIRDRGSLTDLFFFRLKDVTFQYEISAGRLPESMADTLFAVEERMLYPQNRKIQEEYDLYHTKMEQDIKNRTLTGIGTELGVAFFDDSGRGLRNRERYLRHIADNYFHPEFEGMEKLKVYYFSTSDKHIVETARRSAGMFAGGENAPLHVPLSSYLQPQNIMADCVPTVECPMPSDKAGLDSFLKTFRLSPESGKTGITRPNLHDDCFRMRCGQPETSLQNAAGHYPLTEKFRQAAKDIAS